MDEFHTFIEQKDIDVLFMSESWERENKTLDQIINLENHTIISNVHQRANIGGRPAIFANHNKFHVQNITNSLVSIKWGVEAVWCLLTPKNVSNTSKIKKIACAAVYSKPGSKFKSDLLDHISEAFNILSCKYDKGLQFCIAGDTNELNISSILNLAPNMVQIVTKPTRINPKTGVGVIIDPVIMTMAQYYQEPLCLEPLDHDSDKDGKPADHRIVVAKPINTLNNKNARITRKITTRPITHSGMKEMQNWIIQQTWDNVFQTEDTHNKAQIFQDTLITKYEEIFPEKTRKINSDDTPWMTQKLKSLDRKRKRVYHNQRKSEQ